MTAKKKSTTRKTAVEPLAGYDGSTRLPSRRHEKVAQLLATGISQEAAYVGAGYAPTKMHSNSCTLANRWWIVRRVAWLQAQGVKATGVTIQTTTRELEEARIISMAALDTGDMIRASLGKAKINGLLVDKHLVGLKNVEDMTEAELRIVAGLPAETL